MKIKTWSYREPKLIEQKGNYVYIASNVRVAEFEPEFGILEQCWVYLYELEIVKYPQENKTLANKYDFKISVIEPILKVEKLANNSESGENHDY